MENNIKPDRDKIGFSITKTVSIWPQMLSERKFFSHLIAESFPPPELELTVKYHLGSFLATDPALGKRVKANQKPLGTGTLCSKEEEDDPVSADLPTLQST